MKQIENRADVYKLVSEFYTVIRANPVLGPIFNHHILDDQWPAHIDKLTDFWVTNLFGEICFKGNPSQAHLKVDNHLNHNMEQHHFEIWLNLWFETIDNWFDGALAQRAKDAATRMATGQYLFVLKSRQQINT
ncbi:group III truncated hemoglobin [Algibacter miyuki]|uniref:Group III truncated hemoglobin n=1 Tax=Algibacter miyuki TaxID=1306933 RepID=A0ABV5GXY0_9FLAO|nr:group III truncated hemoglobin [Algibacter miyuki]MDN3667318.1 group III truncated hemoglobin [Algibacter miyuki]